MKILVVYNEVSDSADSAMQDVLVQAGAVCRALENLGHRVRTAACGADPRSILPWLHPDSPDLVFNLVESLDGLDRNLHLFPLFLAELGIHFTGSPAAVLETVNHKIRAKEHLRACGLPTPAWLGPLSRETDDGKSCPNTILGEDTRNVSRWILKSLWEHASRGLSPDSVIESDDPGFVLARLAERLPSLGGSGFAEAYIDGREFNLALLAGERGPELLPPAEIDFRHWRGSKAKIVDYRAKWIEDSREYLDTPRRFLRPGEDRELVAELRRLALACWEIFQLQGWARVDFRVDHAGRPWILEVNANPCLSPNAGFVAALGEAGLSQDDAVRRILADPVRYPPAWVRKGNHEAASVKQSWQGDSLSSGTACG